MAAQKYSSMVVFSCVINLAAIRKSVGLTQERLAEELGVKQAQVSKTERSANLLLSTLAAYLRALGVEAELVVRIPGGETLKYSLTSEQGDQQANK